MKIMGISVRQPDATFEDIQALQVPETKIVWQMQRDGFLREIYFDPDRPAVIVVLEAESLEDARTRLAKLPMVSAGLIDFDLVRLGHFSQFSVLFRKEVRDALHD